MGANPTGSHPEARKGLANLPCSAACCVDVKRGDIDVSKGEKTPRLPGRELTPSPRVHATTMRTGRGGPPTQSLTAARA